MKFVLCPSALSWWGQVPPFLCPHKAWSFFFMSLILVLNSCVPLVCFLPVLEVTSFPLHFFLAVNLGKGSERSYAAVWVLCSLEMSPKPSEFIHFEFSFTPIFRTQAECSQILCQDGTLMVSSPGPDRVHVPLWNSSLSAFLLLLVI